MKILKYCTAALLTAVFLAGPAVALADDKAENKEKAKGKPYPLEKCVVADEAFGGDMGEPFVFVHEGREVKLCCKSCKKDFDKETAKYIKKIDAAAKKVKAYTAKTCLVSDEAIDGHGEPFVFIAKGQEVKLCCEECKKDFDKDPAKFLGKLKKDGAKAK